MLSLKLIHYNECLSTKQEHKQTQYINDGGIEHVKFYPLRDTVGMPTHPPIHLLFVLYIYIYFCGTVTFQIENIFNRKFDVSSTTSVIFKLFIYPSWRSLMSSIGLNVVPFANHSLQTTILCISYIDNLSGVNLLFSFRHVFNNS